MHAFASQGNASPSDAARSSEGVDRRTLVGKVMAGYQGWFNAPGDGAGRGWVHFGRRGRFAPDACTIDLWPDVSELSKAERFPTPFENEDGSAAEVFSSHHPKTVDRHFQWMQQFGIDGAFVQRFAVTTRTVSGFHHCNQVLANCRAAANRHGRCYAVMYDLSGLQANETTRVIADWRLLVDRLQLGRGKDAAYLHHDGKPVVAVWGIGFADKRRYGLAECERLVRFFKEDPQYGGNTVVLGLPTHWRTLRRDAVADAKLHEIIGLADVVSPWTVGRYATKDAASAHAHKTMVPDLKWCQSRELDYLPVVFPGFSWHKLKQSAPLAQIPRDKGTFLWRQMVNAHKSGARMVYVAMFDELDEGTAIFKCTNSPPVDGKFLTFEGLPSDQYLWLTGRGGAMLRGEIGVTMPVR